MRVAIISINIGAYHIFWEEFYKTAEKNFMIECEKEYFVFSDAINMFQQTDPKVHYLYHEDMGWPYNTLKRFLLFSSISEKLKNFDYIFFINANAVFCIPLDSSFILDSKKIIVVEHPGRHGDNPFTIPWERRKESCAYVSYEDGKLYVQGAFIGGRSDAFIKMSEELAEKTEIDIKKGIIAKVHDESYLNMYIIGRDDVQILGWQYLYFEECTYPYKPVIMLRNKRPYITNKNGRYLGRNFKKDEFFLFLRNIKWRVFIKLRLYRWHDLTDSDGKYIDNALPYKRRKMND